MSGDCKMTEKPNEKLEVVEIAMFNPKVISETPKGVLSVSSPANSKSNPRLMQKSAVLLFMFSFCFCCGYGYLMFAYMRDSRS